MDYIVIEGVKPYDGRYEFDVDGFTTREWGWIKRLSGYLPLTIDDGFDGGDPELFSCFAAIALRRAGKIENREVAEVYERLIDSPFERAIRLETDEPETELESEMSEAGQGDASPPPPSLSENGSTSGPSSAPSSERSDDLPRATGMPVSATSESRSMPLES
jgi:hypothetical protein